MYYKTKRFKRVSQSNYSETKKYKEGVLLKETRKKLKLSKESIANELNTSVDVISLLEYGQIGNYSETLHQFKKILKLV